MGGARTAPPIYVRGDSMPLMVVLIVVGFALLVAGATALVDGASGLARTIGLSDRVVGLTVVAVGTAMPEIVVSAAAAAGGHAELALGNVIGSNLCNLLLVLGLTALVGAWSCLAGSPTLTCPSPSGPPSWCCSSQTWAAASPASTAPSWSSPLPPSSPSLSPARTTI